MSFSHSEIDCDQWSSSEKYQGHIIILYGYLHNESVQYFNFYIYSQINKQSNRYVLLLLDIASLQDPHISGVVLPERKELWRNNH